MSWLSKRFKFKGFHKMRDAKRVMKKIVEAAEDSGISDAIEEIIATITEAEAQNAIEGLGHLMEEFERDEIDDDVRQQASEFIEVAIEYFGVKLPGE